MNKFLETIIDKHKNCRKRYTFEKFQLKILPNLPFLNLINFKMQKIGKKQIKRLRFKINCANKKFSKFVKKYGTFSTFWKAKSISKRLFVFSQSCWRETVQINTFGSFVCYMFTTNCFRSII